jgi:NTE family protein
MSTTALTKPSLADSAGERASLESVYHARDFSELLVPFGAVATDLVTGLPVVHETGSLVSALMASSAIPGVLPPVEIGGRWFMDALASANLPASIAMRRGAGSIVAFDTGTAPARNTTSTSLAQIVPALNALLAEQQRISSLRTAAREVPVVYLPTPSGLGGTLSFKDSLESAREAYVLGRDFLIDLVDQYGGAPLTPGLYARPDAFGDQTPTAAAVLKPVGGGS